MHDVNNRTAAVTLGVAGMIASLVCLGASMVANYLYGFSLARTVTNGYVYGAAAAAGDVLMAASPFYFFAALRNWKSGRGQAITQMLAALVLWAATTVFAFVAAVSHASTNRLDAASARTVTATSYADTRTDLAEAKQARGYIPRDRLRPEAVVRAEIAAHKAKHANLWFHSSECTEIRGKAQRDVCATYETLNADLGYAISADKLDKRIEELTAKSDRVADQSGTVVASEADAGAKTWADLIGTDLRTMQGRITLGLGLFILLCASLGPYSASAILFGQRYVLVQMPPLQAPPPVDGGPITTPPPKTMLAITAPRRPPPEIVIRKELAPEAKALLASIGFPARPLPLMPTGEVQLHPRDDKDLVAWRFLAWMIANNETGDKLSDEVVKLYTEYCAADYREPWGDRILLSKLAELRWIDKKNYSPVRYIIKPVPLPKLAEALKKAGAVKEPEPTKSKGGNVLSLPLASSDAGKPEAPASVTEPQARRVPSGFAELQKILSGQWSVAREQKRQWQSKMATLHRKQKNRMSRAI